MSLKTLDELLARLGYSRYALESDVITEDMLDHMLTCPGSPAAHIAPRKSDQAGGNMHTICADGKRFDSNPPLVASCN